MLKEQIGNFLLFIVLLLLLLAAGAYLMNLKTKRNSVGIGMCAMDARQCPDGSYVGRIPPDCKFTPCPQM